MTLLRFPRRDLTVDVDDQSMGTSGLTLSGDEFLLVRERLCQGARRRFLALPPHTHVKVTVGRSQGVCQSVKIEACGEVSHHLLPRSTEAPLSVEHGIRSLLEAQADVIKGQALILRALMHLSQTNDRRE